MVKPFVKIKNPGMGDYSGIFMRMIANVPPLAQ